MIVISFFYEKYFGQYFIRILLYSAFFFLMSCFSCCFVPAFIYCCCFFCAHSSCQLLFLMYSYGCGVIFCSCLLRIVGGCVGRCRHYICLLFCLYFLLSQSILFSFQPFSFSSFVFFVLLFYIIVGHGRFNFSRKVRQY